MIEKRIRDFLLTKLTAPIYVDVPANPPDEYVVIERTGGGEDEHIRSAMIAIQSYGKRRLAAGSLHESVLAAMKSLNVRNDVSACQLDAEYDFTDTTTDRYRYQAVFNVVYY